MRRDYYCIFNSNNSISSSALSTREATSNIISRWKTGVGSMGPLVVVSLFFLQLQKRHHREFRPSSMNTSKQFGFKTCLLLTSALALGRKPFSLMESRTVRNILLFLVWHYALKIGNNMNDALLWSWVCFCLCECAVITLYDSADTFNMPTSYQ